MKNKSQMTTVKNLHPSTSYKDKTISPWLKSRSFMALIGLKLTNHLVAPVEDEETDEVVFDDNVRNIRSLLERVSLSAQCGMLGSGYASYRLCGS
ncbi:hypothetical protein Tco_0988896 [Tanacetum coccineum]|uniref:Uncharacterized protein n=1 Tax=Tanacetum coccineum TaxID=301880 RepID=A0ABQ5ETI1_9ASTR